MPLSKINPWSSYWRFSIPGAATAALPLDWAATVKFCIWTCSEDMLIEGYLQFDNSRQLTTMLNYAPGSYWKPSKNSSIEWDPFLCQSSTQRYGAPIELRSKTPSSRKTNVKRTLELNDEYWSKRQNVAAGATLGERTIS